MHCLKHTAKHGIFEKRDKLGALLFCPFLIHNGIQRLATSAGFCNHPQYPLVMTNIANRKMAIYSGFSHRNW